MRTIKRNNKQTKTHRRRAQQSGYRSAGGSEVVNGNGAQKVVVEENLTLGGSHKMQHIDDVS